MPDFSQPPQVVAVSGDPGGANALAPVIAFLRQSGRVQIEARAYRQARDVWRKRGLDLIELDEAAEPALPESTELLLTSTSVNEVNFEKRYIAAAGRQGIPSVAVLDFWSNYGPRFGSEPILPDKIAVMDVQARDEMIAEGFDAGRLVITGQPAFDELLSWGDAFTGQRRREVRALMGATEEELLVVFASQPFSILCKPGVEQVFPSPGYDERMVAALLVQALEKIAGESSRRIVLAVRPHPREDAANLRHLHSDLFRIHVGNEGDSREAIAAADLVVGMNSALLVEACYLGCPVVSLQPNLKSADALPTNRRGFSRAAYTAEEVLPAIREMLLDESARRVASRKLEQFRPSGDAAQRVAELVCTLLQRDTISTHS